jgi:hypothetical protein
MPEPAQVDEEKSGTERRRPVNRRSFPPGLQPPGLFGLCEWELDDLKAHEEIKRQVREDQEAVEAGTRLWDGSILLADGTIVRPLDWQGRG